MAQVCGGKKILDFFKAICDLHRHQILYLLKSRGALNATEIMHKIKLSQPTVSHHLKILVEAEVLSARKEGKETYYQINEKNINYCCHNFVQGVCSNKSQK